MKQTIGKMFSKELESEAMATKKCLERIPIEKLSGWKPHEKSMQMGVLSIIVAEIPRWIHDMATKSYIDFANSKPVKIKTTQELVSYFDKNIEAAKKALNKVSDKELEKMFSLKKDGHVLSLASKKDFIGSSINHLAHHRGQLTVYMRLNEILVPSIYGPSADDIVWK